MGLLNENYNYSYNGWINITIKGLIKLIKQNQIFVIFSKIENY